MHNQKGKVGKCPFQSKFKNRRRAPPPHQSAHTDLKILQWNAGGMSQNKKTELHLNLVKHHKLDPLFCQLFNDPSEMRKQENGTSVLSKNFSKHKHSLYVEIKCQLDATEVFIADLIACSTCFGHHYAHHQELKSILYSGCCLWYFVLWFSSCWSGVELSGYVSGLQDAAASCKPDI